MGFLGISPRFFGNAGRGNPMGHILNLVCSISLDTLLDFVGNLARIHRTDCSFSPDNLLDFNRIACSFSPDTVLVFNRSTHYIGLYAGKEDGARSNMPNLCTILPRGYCLGHYDSIVSCERALERKARIIRPRYLSREGSRIRARLGGCGQQLRRPSYSSQQPYSTT